jgi:hypothetical protein
MREIETLLAFLGRTGWDSSYTLPRNLAALTGRTLFSFGFGVVSKRFNLPIARRRAAG